MAAVKKVKKPEARKPEAGGLLGAHISTAGGVVNAPPRADEIGATAMQNFTKQPNRWAETDIAPADALAFREALGKSGVRFTNAPRASRATRTRSRNHSSRNRAGPDC